MPPSVSSSFRRWVGWDRSGLTVEMKPCLLLSDRLSSSPPWVSRSQRLKNPLVPCGWRKFQIDCLGDHPYTCTAHSGAKKEQDWTVDQITDLFHTTQKVKTQEVVKIRSQSIDLIITIGLQTQYHLWLLLIVRLGGYIPHLYVFYSYSLIGKLTVFLQFRSARRCSVQI